jgi:hypothetical protein
MGYDAGFLEGHRTARPVVVPLRETDHAGSFSMPPATMPLWGRDVMPPARSHALPHSPRAVKQRLVAWAGDKRAAMQQRAGHKRTPILQWAGDRQNLILAGALCLALVGVLVAGLAVRMPAAVDALEGPSGSLFHRAVSPSGQTPALEGESPSSKARVAAGGSRLAPAAPDATGRPGAPGGSGGSGEPAAGTGGVAAGADTVGSSGLSNLPSAAGGGVVPAIIHVPAPSRSATTPPVVAAPYVPVVAAPAVPLTAAQQTAADAAAAAALTAANASAAAALTAANAKSAADLTAATAAAAAAATAQAAADAAWAVAHPQP